MATVIQEAIFKLKLDYSEVKKGVDEIGSSFGGLTSLGNKMTGLGNTLSKNVTMPIIAMGTAALTAAVSFESAFAGVRKTVNASEADLGKLSDAIKQMSLEVPVTAEEIAKVAEAAGQLGIQTESIMSFTRTMIDLGVATNLTADEAATMLARFANVTGLPQKEFSNLGSTIVALGNNFATTEAEITALGQRLASAGTTAKVSAPEIMGFAAALSSVGIEAEAGGTAFSKLFTNIYAATQTGGKELTKFAKVAGMSADQFAEAYQKNATGAIVSFVEGLGRIEKNGGSVIKTLDDLGITEVRMRNALLSSANAGELLSKAINLANSSYKENNALTKEAEQRYATTASQLALLWNNVKALGYEFGEIMLPALRSVVSGLTSAVQWFSGLSDTVKTVITVVAGVAAAIGPVLLALGTLSSLLPTLAAGFALLTGPIGWTIAAVTALGAAVYYIYDNWGGIVDWFEDQWYLIKIVHLKAVDKILEYLSKLGDFIPSLAGTFVVLRSAITEAINETEVNRRAQLVERNLEKVAAEADKAAFEMEKMGDSSVDAGDAASEAALKAAQAQEKHREELEAVNEAIADVVSSYEDNMTAFDREVEIGVRIADDGESRLRHEIEQLTSALTRAAADVNIDIDSAPILALRQRLQEAKADLIGLKQGAEPASIAIRSMSGEIDSAADSLSLMSKITGEAIAADTWRKAKDAVEDYGDAVEESGENTQGITDGLSNYLLPAMNVWADSTKSVGDKFNALAQIALSSIPGIGGALAGLLGVMDSVGMGLDDIGRKIAGLFTKGKVADSGAAWFKEVNRLIQEFKEQGLSDLQIISDLKILFPNISEETLRALVEGTSEAFAEYNKWLADPKNKLMEGSEDMGKKLAEALASGLSDTAAIEKVLKELMKGIDPNSWQGAGLEKAYTENLQKILAALKEFGIDHDDFFANLADPADQAAIELESALIRIRETLEKNVDTIAEKLKAGLITQEMADTSILKEYEKAIDDMFEAGLKADDPRVLAMIEAWKALGGGAKDAAEETGEATDEMAEAIKKQEAVYAETLAKLQKLEEENAALIALGVKSQTEAQKEQLRAYQKAIEDLVDAGLKPDDPRLIAMVDAWKALGGSVEDATDKVKETVTEQEKAAQKLQDIYDKLASSVAEQTEAIRQSWESGATDGLSAMQDEAVLLRDAIESLLRDGMNPDDERIRGWQSRLDDINQNMKDLGLSTYEVIDPTDKVGQAWRRAGESLTETLDHIEKRDLAGLFTKQTDMLREQANAYKRAIEDFLKSGDPDDPRIQGWLEALRNINEELTKTGEKAIEVKDKFELAAEAIKAKLDEKLGNLEFDMRFNFEGADDDLDIQIEKTKAKMKALNDAIIAAGNAGFDKQSEFVQELMQQYQDLFDTLGDLEWQKLQESVVDTFQVTMDKLGDLEQKYKLFGDTQEYLAAKMKLLKDAINKMIEEGIDPEDDRLLELSEQYKEAAKAAQLYADSQKEIKDAIKDAVGVGTDQEAKNSVLMKLGEAAIELWSKVNALIQTVSGDAVLWLAGWSADVLGIFRKTLDDSRTFREQVINEQSAAFSGLADIIRTSWNLATSGYNAFIAELNKDLHNILPTVHNTAMSYKTGIMSGVEALLEMITEVQKKLTAVPVAFAEASSTEFAKVLTMADELANAMKDAFTEAIKQMKDSLIDFATVTVSFSTDAPNTVSGAQIATASMTSPAPNSLPSSLMSQTAAQQIIYVNLDSRVVSQAVFEGLPEVVRMNTGGLR